MILPNRTTPRGRLSRAARGFTIAETLTTMAIFSLTMLAFTYAYMFGMRQDQLVQSKLGASDESRRSFERVARDIRSANSQSIGNYVGGTFTPTINGSTNGMTGNAIRIYLTATNNNNIIYYFDTNGAANSNIKLFRVHTGDAQPICIASNLQNSASFTAENYAGVVQTDMQDKYVIHFSLDFCEFQYPLTKVGAGYYYDRYVMDFRATPHVPTGR